MPAVPPRRRGTVRPRRSRCGTSQGDPIPGDRLAVGDVAHHSHRCKPGGAVHPAPPVTPTGGSRPS
ncbi:hypothetical protein VR41_08265 [Streptomyces sp. NRRL B-1568]|nr:hypothetical protein VR41_08265 [Streptomyces sp. NRRL B-1568]